jgi:hypothetical protein
LPGIESELGFIKEEKGHLAFMPHSPFAKALRYPHLFWRDMVGVNGRYFYQVTQLYQPKATLINFFILPPSGLMGNG